MLNEKASSSINLRVETSRRHSIRNLRAKVRSLLPQQTCLKEKKRSSNHQKFFVDVNCRQRPSSAIQPEKKMNKEFDKLTLKELYEVNSNKYYFLGNEESISHFEQYLNENHPQLNKGEFEPPLINANITIPFGFVPFPSGVKKDNISYKLITSGNKLFEKRGSAISQAHKSNHSLLQAEQIKALYRQNKQRAEQCISRKQAIEQQLKIKREISSAHLQRQQDIAVVNRDNYLRQISSNARSRYTANSKCDEAVSTHREQYQVASLTVKLRKICLKRAQPRVQFLK